MSEDFVQMRILANDTQFQGVLKNVIATIQGLRKQMESLGHLAKEALTVGLFGFSIAEFIKGAEDLEKSVMDFHHALEANGAAVDTWGKHLDEVVEHLARVTSHSDDAIRGLMTMGLNRGVGVDQLDNMTRAAIALSRITGGGLSASLRQLMTAQEGAFGGMTRAIYQLRNLHSDSEKMALINKKLAEGWRQEGEALESTEMMQHKLHEALNSLKQDLGEALLPALLKFYDHARALVLKIRDWVAINKELVNSVIRWTTVILSVVVAIPVLTHLVHGLRAAFMLLVTTPMGILTMSVMAIGAALLYAAGSGDSFFERLESGFNWLLGELDFMLGSWSNFYEELVYIWDNIKDSFRAAWEIAIDSVATIFVKFKHWLLNFWNDLSKGFEDNFVDPMAKAILYIQYKTGALTEKQYEGAKKELPGVLQDMRKERYKDQDKTKADNEIAEAKRLRELGQEHQDNMAGIGKENLDRQRQHKKIVGEGLKLSDHMKKLFGVEETGSTLGEAPKIEMTPGAGKQFQPHFEEAQAGYQRMAAWFAGPSNNPMDAIKRNTEAALSVQKEQLAVQVQIRDKKNDEKVLEIPGAVKPIFN